MKALLTSAVLLVAACSTSQFKGSALPVTRTDLVGTYSAPVLVTWTHIYELRADGSAKYEVAYDSFEPLPNDEFQSGHSYHGEWRPISTTDVVITFPRKDGRIVPFVLRSVSVRGMRALAQLSPAETIDGYSGEMALTFFKEKPNKSPEPTAGSVTPAADAPVAPPPPVAHR